MQVNKRIELVRLVIYGLVCAAALYAYRSFRRESQRVAMRVKRAQAERKTGASGTLVQDPKTGEYHVDRG